MGALGASGHSKKGKGLPLGKIIPVQVDECLEDGKNSDLTKNNGKFKLVVGMQDECCFYGVLPGWLVSMVLDLYT